MSKKADTIKLAKDRLATSGIPAHLCAARSVPKQVALSVLVGANLETVHLGSSATADQVQRAVDGLAEKWRAHKNGQVDLEEAVAESEHRAA